MKCFFEETTFLLIIFKRILIEIIVSLFAQLSILIGSYKHNNFMFQKNRGKLYFTDSSLTLRSRSCLDRCIPIFTFVSLESSLERFTLPLYDYLEMRA